MAAYVALLRGVAPSNPTMRNERLRGVAEGLDLDNVQTVISSGNVLFETDSTDVAELEATLESGWQRDLGFEATTILRSRDQLEDLVGRMPFGELEHSPETYLLVTFSKSRLTVEFDLPHGPEDKAYSIVDATPWELFTVTDTRVGNPDVMGWLEKEYGKRITSRTWLTVNRILERMKEETPGV